jgi:hypothetical protein
MSPNEKKISRRWRKRDQNAVELLKSFRDSESKDGQRLAASIG